MNRSTFFWQYLLTDIACLKYPGINNDSPEILKISTKHKKLGENFIGLLLVEKILF